MSASTISHRFDSLVGTVLVACRFRTPGVRSSATWHFADGCVLAVTTLDLAGLDRLRYAAHRGAVLSAWTGTTARFAIGNTSVDVVLVDVELFNDSAHRSARPDD